MRDDRLIGLATFAVGDASRVGSLFASLPGVLCPARGRAGESTPESVRF